MEQFLRHQVFEIDFLSTLFAWNHFFLAVWSSWHLKVYINAKKCKNVPGTKCQVSDQCAVRSDIWSKYFGMVWSKFKIGKYTNKPILCMFLVLETGITLKSKSIYISFLKFISCKKGVLPFYNIFVFYSIWLLPKLLDMVRNRNIRLEIIFMSLRFLIWTF